MSSFYADIFDHAQPTKLPFEGAINSFVSGSREKQRLIVDYFKNDAEAGVLYAKITFGEKAEGPPGHAHGGAQAAVIDEICGGALWVWGYQVVAAKLETEFIKMVPLDEELVLEGRLVRQEGKKIFTEGFIKDRQGTTLAKGSVLFILIGSQALDRLKKQRDASK